MGALDSYLAWLLILIGIVLSTTGNYEQGLACLAVVIAVNSQLNRESSKKGK